MEGTKTQHHKDDDNVVTATLSDSMGDASEVAALTLRVINVSLSDVSETVNADQAEMVSNTPTPLPRREDRVRLGKTRSVTSFVSCSSTPIDSATTVTKSVRPIDSYFALIVRSESSTDETRKKSSGKTVPHNVDNVGADRSITPNILEGLEVNASAKAPKPILPSSTSD